MLILGGNITANAGNSAAGIGSGGNGCSCGDITIKWGTVTASGVRGAAIGSGGYSSCGNITIDNTVDKISACRKQRKDSQPSEQEREALVAQSPSVAKNLKRASPIILTLTNHSSFVAFSHM